MHSPFWRRNPTQTIPLPPSFPYVTHKIRQIWFSFEGRKPRNKKTKGAAENQRNPRLCIAESRKPVFFFLNNYRPCIHPLDSNPPLLEMLDPGPPPWLMVRYFRTTYRWLGHFIRESDRSESWFPEWWAQECRESHPPQPPDLSTDRSPAQAHSLHNTNEGRLIQYSIYL